MVERIRADAIYLITDGDCMDWPQVKRVVEQQCLDGHTQVPIHCVGLAPKVKLGGDG